LADWSKVFLPVSCGSKTYTLPAAAITATTAIAAANRAPIPPLPTPELPIRQEHLTTIVAPRPGFCGIMFGTPPYTPSLIVF